VPHAREGRELFGEMLFNFIASVQRQSLNRKLEVGILCENSAEPSGILRIVSRVELLYQRCERYSIGRDLTRVLRGARVVRYQEDCKTEKNCDMKMYLHHFFLSML